MHVRIIFIFTLVYDNFRPNFEPQLKYLVITLADNCLEAIIPKIKDTKDFIDSCLRSGGKVLVHCNDGMSRSQTF